jgi:NAD(P)-dependent dehydrogenase (short-subunit alcohol dehydrogenase family)
MDLGLKDQVAIVTGGSRGIGRAAAEALLREGAKVVVSSVRPASVEAAVKELSTLGTVEGIAADVSAEADVVRLVAETVNLFGGLDVMVANAGIGGDSVNLADMTAAQWDEMMAVHLRGSFLCGREAARAMRSAGRRGRIVTVGSSSGFESEASGGHYCAAKAGIHGLTRSMAVDFAQWGIRANCVAPGWVRTDMTVDEIPPPGESVVGCGVIDRVGNPEEIANAIVFLASESCGFMTGETLVVDGGQLIIAPDPNPSSSGG